MPDSPLSARAGFIQNLLDARPEAGFRPPLPREAAARAQEKGISQDEAMLGLVIRMLHAQLLEESMRQPGGGELTRSLSGITSDDAMIERLLGPIREQAALEGSVRRR